MSPISHIIVSFSAGAGVWFFAKSLYAGLVCFIAGIFLDLDHIIEYVIHYGWKDLSPGKVYQTCEQTTRQEGERQFPKLYLLFHSGEVAILLWIGALYIKNLYLIIIALGYSMHMAMDCIGNPMYVYSYFIIWRMIKGFAPEMLFRKQSGQTIFK